MRCEVYPLSYLSQGTGMEVLHLPEDCERYFRDFYLKEGDGSGVSGVGRWGGWRGKEGGLGWVGGGISDVKEGGLDGGEWGGR